MSDPREYNYISANNGLQVSIGSYWDSSQTWTSGLTKAAALPVDLTNLVLSGNILLSDGTQFPLVEVLVDGTTGIKVNADRTTGQYTIQVSEADSGSLTVTIIGIYDIRYTDLTPITKVLNKGKIEFQLTASS
tara:strand:- start:3705 stop:4103 length:399 start_codon:yes stop_codon:yes gene_type:complete